MRHQTDKTNDGEPLYCHRALLRTHIQHCSNANFIFAGSERHIMNEMFLDTARPFYNSADMLVLKPIAEDRYTDFAARHFAASGKAIDEEAIHSAYQMFAGNTYYMQKTMHATFAETEQGHTASKELIGTVIQQMMDDSNHRYGEHYVDDQMLRLWLLR